MSAKSESIVMRQWFIINFLLKRDTYVSSHDILAHLTDNGIDTEIRNIQRDLNTLQKVLPLECRKDDRPYSWRWQRISNAKEHQLTQSQAIVFRLIETELSEHIPEEILTKLEPILQKSRYLLAVEGFKQTTENDAQGHAIDMSKLGKGQGMHGHGGFGGGGIGGQPSNPLYIIKNIVDGIPLPKSPFNKRDDAIKHIDKLTLDELKDTLDAMKLSMLAAEVEEFIRKNKLK